jgi:hypothetical protein
MKRRKNYYRSTGEEEISDDLCRTRRAGFQNRGGIKMQGGAFLLLLLDIAHSVCIYDSTPTPN